MVCPHCDCHHDGPYLYCEECLEDFRKMLESGDSGVVWYLTEFLSSALTKREEVA